MRSDSSSTGPAPEAADEADRVARVALTTVAEPGHPTIWSMVEHDGAPAALERLLAGDAPDASLRAAVTARTAKGDVRRFAQLAVRRAQRIGARLVVPGDREWPAQVDDLARLESSPGDGPVARDTKPPLCLWVRGDWSLREAFPRSVAVVGARAATPYGKHVSTELAHELATRGWTIVSGGAFGVEAAAHRGALTADGLTVAVLACGIDRPYPAGNADLFDQIIERGLLVSLWPTGAEPLRHRFGIRNRLIATAAGTVLVEAAARSGAVQTISRALDLDRPAMVVPGPVTSAMSVGCHNILRAHIGARIVTSAADVITELTPATS
ncbi:DNA-processing protein DprA [Actinoplanes sp. NPDC049316]|uniref:DNA-processing protein DprA n=1 Tax=Actinoplanes sp. NPDC049316 TaxID=3154727 RepID=UPI00342AEE72